MAAPSGATPLLGLPFPVADDDVNVPRDIQALAEAVEARGGFIIGEVRFIAVAAPPRGWLLSDGRAVSRGTYAALYAEIGELFGAGDGSTTFNLPPVPGRALVGAGAGAGLTARTVGTRWGVEAVVLSTAQMPSHGHGVNDPGHLHYISSFPDASGGILALTNLANASVPNAAATQAALTGISIAANGGNQGHDNTQPSLALPAFIYAGV